MPPLRRHEEAHLLAFPRDQGADPKPTSPIEPAAQRRATRPDRAAIGAPAQVAPRSSRKEAPEARVQRIAGRCEGCEGGMPDSRVVMTPRQVDGGKESRGGSDAAADSRWSVARAARKICACPAVRARRATRGRALRQAPSSIRSQIDRRLAAAVPSADFSGSAWSRSCRCRSCRSPMRRSAFDPCRLRPARPGPTRSPCSVSRWHACLALAGIRAMRSWSARP